MKKKFKPEMRNRNDIENKSVNLFQFGTIFIVFIVTFYTNAIPAKNFEQFMIENPSVDESSGLAASNTHKNILWTHNDSGNTPSIYAMDEQGRHKASFYLDEVINRDWEDMASFRWKDQGYLLIADTGDNYQMFLSSFIYVFREPNLSNDSKSAVAKSPVWTIEYQYEDGHLYDVEAVSVDVDSGQIILLTKRTRKVHVFLLPLFPEENRWGGWDERVRTAIKIAELDYIKNPTAMDYSPITKQAAILSYGRVYLYQKKLKQSWESVLKKPLKVLKYRNLYQPEAMCFSNDGKRIFISSEKLPAKLLRIHLK